MSTIQWVASGLPASDGHMFMTSTDGSNWLGVPPSNIFYLDWSFTNDIKFSVGMWIAVGKGIRRSTGADCPAMFSTDGSHWLPIINFNFNPNNNRLEGTGIDFSGTWVMSVRMYNSANYGTGLLFKSTDGYNWHLINTSTTISGDGFYDVRWINDRWFVVGFGSIYGTSGYIFTTTNANATNWTIIDWPYPLIIPTKITLFNNRIAVISVFNPGFIYISDPGYTGTWTSYNIDLNLATRDLTSTGVHIYAVGTSSDPIRRCNYNVSQWSTPTGATSIGTEISAISKLIQEGISTKMIVANATGQLARSLDAGDSWESLNIPTEVKIGRVNVISYRPL